MWREAGPVVRLHLLGPWCVVACVPARSEWQRLGASPFDVNPLGARRWLVGLLGSGSGVAAPWGRLLLTSLEWVPCWQFTCLIT